MFVFTKHWFNVHKGKISVYRKFRYPYISKKSHTDIPIRVSIPVFSVYRYTEHPKNRQKIIVPLSIKELKPNPYSSLPSLLHVSGKLAINLGTDIAVDFSMACMRYIIDTVSVFNFDM